MNYDSENRGPFLADVVRALHARKSGANWIAKCPSHKDKSPSLSVREQGNRVLIHCHAGCSQSEVIDALKSLGLWPEHSRREHRLHADDPDRLGDLRRAEFWGHAARLLTESLLGELSPTDSDRLPLTSLLHSTRNAGRDGLLALYREHRRRNPELTAALVYSGRRSVVRLEEHLTEWILKGLPEDMVLEELL